jgi:hypothetical protein
MKVDPKAVNLQPAPTPMLRALRTIALTVTWLVVTLLTLWALAALYIDVRIPALRIPLTLLYALGVAAVLAKSERRTKAAALCSVGFCVVLAWWLGLRPSNEGAWRPDTDHTAWAEINGNHVMIHNLRNCDYQTERDYMNCWGDRTVDLSQIRAVDLFFINWGLRWMDHTIASFQFGDSEHIAFSVEPRSKIGQAYSGLRGFFREYELIFVAADERDVIRLRTNYRKDEAVYMYRTLIQPQEARDIFLTYLNYLNQLKDHPQWYNALTRNCTTTMGREILGDVSRPRPSYFSILLNGSLDELLYSRGRLATGGLPFPELKQREHINAAARAADQSPDFSALIRVGRIAY